MYSASMGFFPVGILDQVDMTKIKSIQCCV
jgi:hypothetical protein